MHHTLELCFDIIAISFHSIELYTKNCILSTVNFNARHMHLYIYFNRLRKNKLCPVNSIDISFENCSINEVIINCAATIDELKKVVTAYRNVPV